MNFQRKYLKKWFGGFSDDHPIIKNIKLYPNSKKYWNTLLSDLDSVTGLRRKIAEMKRDVAGYKSILSELEFCRKINDFNPKFISSNTRKPTPDIEATVSSQSVYFEVKSLMETDEMRHVFEEIRKIKSYYFIWISYDRIDKDQSEDIIEIVKKLIEEKSTGIFVTKDGDFQIEIEKKRKIPGKPRSRKTAIIMDLREPVKIGKEELKYFRKKIIMDFFKKERQLKSVQPIFLVLYLNRWIMEPDDIRRIFYGTICEDLVVGIRNFKGFEKIYEIERKHPDIAYSSGLIPKFIYPEKDGLFFIDNFDILNGIISVKRNQCSFIINPFAQNQISQNLFRALRNFFNK